MTIVAGAEDTGKGLDAFLHERLAEFSRSRCNPGSKSSAFSSTRRSAGFALCCAAARQSK
jgi:hypothetical protein